MKSLEYNRFNNTTHKLNLARFSPKDLVKWESSMAKISIKYWEYRSGQPALEVLVMKVL